MERSAKLKPLIGGKCAREESLCGLSSLPVGFPRILRPLAFSLGIQALGEVSHFTNLIFSFSNLTNKTLLTIWLILGVNSSVGKLSAKEEFATESSSTPLLRFDWKAMAWSDSLFVSLRTDKLGWVSKPYVTHLLDGFSALSDPDHISARWCNNYNIDNNLDNQSWQPFVTTTDICLSFSYIYY